MQSSAGTRIARRIFLIQQANLASLAPFTTYLVILIAQLPPEKLSMATLPLPAFALIFGVGLPYLAVSRAVHKALAKNPADPPGARLTRILKLPRVLEMWVSLIYIFGGAMGYLVYFVAVLGMPPLIIPWGTTVIAGLVMLVMIWTRIFIERTLMPVALEEFRKYPDAPLDAGGLLWPRQRWYLPYAFGLFVLCTLITTGTVAVRVGLSKYQELLAVLPPESAEQLRRTAASFIETAWLPTTILGLFMLVSASLSAIQLARQQHRGFLALQESIEGFASGAPRRPAWVTTDELGELSRATSRAFDRLREFSFSLGTSATSLGDSARLLDQSNTLHNQVLTRQAAALQETQVTAQEIRQTSLLAAQKAETILQQTDVVEKLGRSGEQAIAQSIGSLQEIHEQVSQMADRIRQLDDNARQIGRITGAVKSLADQSNMLALNAAIEAVRSGEHGKGFGVVAREIRSLADQSIRATQNVTTLLEDISQSIRSTVEMTEKGAERVSASVEQVKSFGDNMHRLSSIMQESSQAVRQISAAVNQQSQGVVQIFDAIKDLNHGMNDTMERLKETSTATVDVRGIASQVSQLITGYGWESTKNTDEEGPPPRRP